MQSALDRLRRLDRLDIGVGVAIIVLLLAIGVTILGGDRAGVGVDVALPTHVTMPIQFTFSEPMDSISVESRFSIDPPVKGTLNWSGILLTFLPSDTLSSASKYTVTIRAGAVSNQGRLLLKDAQWSFQVVNSRLLYLAPALQQRVPPNLWMADPDSNIPPKQLTFSATGLLPDYAPSPDGTRVVYAEKAVDGTADLYLLTIDTGEIQRVTHCVQAMCQAPDWSPDESRIVYERTDLADTLPQAEQGLSRAWIVNLKDLSTAPLIADTQVLGKLPRWSPNNVEIAVYDQRLHGIAVYNLANGGRKLIPTMVEETGAFDLAGNLLVFANLAETPQGFFNALSIADLANPTNGLRPLTAKDGPLVDDVKAAWMPDGRKIGVTRRYLTENATQGTQVYLIDPATAEVQPLVVDANYNHAAISWDPAGGQLVMQRYPVFESEGQPEIWVYTMQTKALKRIASDAFMPRWLP